MIFIINNNRISTKAYIKLPGGQLGGLAEWRSSEDEEIDEWFIFDSTLLSQIFII